MASIRATPLLRSSISTTFGRYRFTRLRKILRLSAKRHCSRTCATRKNPFSRGAHTCITVWLLFGPSLMAVSTLMTIGPADNSCGA
jgi:hypothetical protein